MCLGNNLFINNVDSENDYQSPTQRSYTLANMGFLSYLPSRDTSLIHVFPQTLFQCHTDPAYNAGATYLPRFIRVSSSFIEMYVKTGKD